MPPSTPQKTQSELAIQECEALEADLAALKVAYEQYFLGMERHAPLKAHEDLKKRVAKLKTAFARSTMAKFRIGALAQKLVSYERMWSRTLAEIESGTYKRDLLKARRRGAAAPMRPAASAAQAPPAPEPEDITDSLLSALEEVDGPPPPPPAARPPAAPAGAPPAGTAPGTRPVSAPAAAAPPPSFAPGRAAAAAPPSAPRVPGIAPGVAPIAPRPGAPESPLAAAVARAAPPSSPAARPGASAPPPARAPSAAPPSSAGGPALSEDRLRAVYDAYVTAKRRCQEDTSKLTYESVAASLRKQVPELIKQHKAQGVDFKVVIKDGKAVLKAVPK